MLKNLFILFFITTFTALATAQDGHKIAVTLDNYDQEELYLGYYFADKQYLKDTVQRNDNGVFVFQSDTAKLDAGMYLVVMAPDNNYFQLMVNDHEQHFSVKTDAKSPNEKMQVSGSKDNKLFYDYLSYLGKQRPLAESLNKGIAEATDENAKKGIQQKLTQLNESVQKYQTDLIENNPQTLSSALIRVNMSPEIPKFTGEDADVKRWRWMQERYFDQIDMADDRMIRTPFLFQRVNNYVEKMVVQHPDTIYEAVDLVLQKVQPAEASFKFFLTHFLNKYAAAKVVGQDAVYVKIAQNYYAQGLAPWTEEEQLKKIVDNANTLEPLLIGKTAPDFKAYQLDIPTTLSLAETEESEHKKFKLANEQTLHGVESPYTVLIFWAPDCGHCKKAMPDLKKFYTDYKDKGVEVFMVCTKTYKEVPDCAEILDENQAFEWMNIVDPYMRSRMTATYDVRSTPQIYVLDADKEIISKRIGSEQLPEVIDQIMKQDAERAQGGE
ncbi:MAG: thioredoxin-like domain-containing protein [Saprospiraceae bacterium]